MFQIASMTDSIPATNRLEISALSLRNKNGTTVRITPYGARVMEWRFRNINLVAGYNQPEEYLSATEPYYGATIGRFANRIAHGRFVLNGEQHQLIINNPPNHLHGGPGGFHAVMWKVLSEDEHSITLQYHSPDGEEGYPGNLLVNLQYTLTDDDALHIRYEATSDAATVVNLTHHSYFNLNGEGSGDILQHEVQIAADYFTPITKTLIPTGEIRSVEGTPFDFRLSRTVGERIGLPDEQLQFGRGYDHNFVLSKNDDGFAARVRGDRTGVVLEVFTDQPGMQFYTGNFMTGTNTMASGKKDEYRTAFCLETQHFPDSPNQPAFPSTVLLPGETFRSFTTYKLS